MKKPWFRSVTFWTGLIITAAAAGPFAAALWCAGFMAYRLTSKNYQKNTQQERAPFNTMHNRPANNSHEKGQYQEAEQQKQGQYQEAEQQKQGPHNPYQQSSQYSPIHTPASPKAPKSQRGHNGKS